MITISRKNSQMQTDTMPSVLVSTPPAALRLHWDVFLSFRGEDTRHTIIKNVYDSLAEHGVRVFRDDVGMSQGDEIAPSLLEAIEDSAASIIMLSPRYADSHWCLEELTTICQLRRLILPVFYKVDPSHVRKQTGPFENDFRTHTERFGEEKVGRWREAMKKVGGISGLPYNISKEPQLIQQLVKRVLTELRRTVGLATYTVGLDSRAEELVNLLNVKSNHIKVLGLHGMGGIGKTTLSKALYNKLLNYFEYRCFIPNVRETATEDGGLVSLQNKFLSALSPVNMSSVHELEAGVSMIKRMLHEKRVFAVLDDVDNVSQLNALAGNREWFGEGSRIIITTRNKDVLVEYLVNEVYEVRELYSTEALQLFSYHALRREKPTNDYLNLAKNIVSLTGGLPLALEVFGSYLFHKRTVKEWEDALKKLQQIRPNNLQDVLRISFDALDEEEKCIFLDIACLFVKIEMKREEAIDIFKGCGFRGETAITVLTEKSLIKLREELGGHILWMHDQLREMGKQIVLLENLTDPGTHSRLWNYDEIMTVLKHNKGTRNVQGIILELRKKQLVEDDRSVHTIFHNNFLSALNLTSVFEYLKEKCAYLLRLPKEEKEGEIILNTNSFESMVNLRLLQINGVKLEGKFEHFPRELKWLQWKKCPFRNLPSDYRPSQLAILDLSESGIDRVCGWRSNMVAEKLMVLNLRYCYNLVAIPDLSGCKTLEKLDLEMCNRLPKIHKSVGNLRTLLKLNLKDCSNLIELPSDVSGLKELQKLVLSGCKKLKELPEDIGSMKSLEELLLDQTAISKLPESIYRLTKLEKLSLNGCQFIKQLPKCLGNLNSLKQLSLNETALEELPDSVGSLSNLETLSLMWCNSLSFLPASIGKLESLTEIFVDSSAIEELPYSIGSLSYLKQLSAGGCPFLSKLPDSIGGLSSITELQLDRTPITDLPDQIGALRLTEKLYLRKCALIRSLPEALGSMYALTVLNLFGSNITELPESIGMLENLIQLTLRECKQLQKLPASIGNLKSLHRLLMERTGVTELPESFGMLSNLMILKMRKKPLKSLSAQEKLFEMPTSFPNLSLLKELDARAWGISGKIPDDFEKLSKLEILDLGYNKFDSLPSSLQGLSLLKNLCLKHCEKLISLPPLPSSLEELDISNCIALRIISDTSNLESLKQLNLTNCDEVLDIPGFECMKSLVRLYMSGCRACSVPIKRKLSKDFLRNIRYLSIPGSKIPDWFSQAEVSYSERRNYEIKAVLVCAVISLDHQIPDDLRDEIPVLPAIQTRMSKPNKPLCVSTLDSMGVPKTNADQIHLCRYPDCHPLVLGLKDGFKVEVMAPDPPIIKGVQVKKCGIHLVFENDDDYIGNEELLDESQLSLSAKLAKFFQSNEEDGHEAC